MTLRVVVCAIVECIAADTVRSFIAIGLNPRLFAAIFSTS